MGNPNYRNGFNLTLHEHVLDYPIKWKKPKIIFVNSMSDLFHEKVPIAFIKKVFTIMHRADQHCFQILTKRSSRLTQISPMLKWPENVWMGVTIEKKDYLYRIDDLAKTAAKIKFISFEPLLGPIDDFNHKGIDWVIVGGESGPRARPIKKEWIARIRDICLENNIKFFFKQWGGKNKKQAGRLFEGRTWDEMPDIKFQQEHLTLF
jgi:protein gp37